MAQRQTLATMLEDRYADDELRDAIRQNIEELGTGERILAGELHLPTEQDALHWHRRLTGRDKFTDEQWRDRQRVAELEKQVDALNEQYRSGPNVQYVEELKKRVEALEGRG